MNSTSFEANASHEVNSFRKKLSFLDSLISLLSILVNVGNSHCFGARFTNTLIQGSAVWTNMSDTFCESKQKMWAGGRLQQHCSQIAAETSHRSTLPRDFSTSQFLRRHNHIYLTMESMRIPKLVLNLLGGSLLG